jgi:beta-galactosidase
MNSTAQTFPRKDLRFIDNWRFYLGDATGADAITFNDAAWDTVCLPHTARVESAKTHSNYDYYQGYYWYRKSFTPDLSFRGKKVFLEIEAGMQSTQVWINGTSKLTYQGGYNPFTIDITNDLVYNQTNVIAMRLNNSVNTAFSPGEQPDFYFYGGLYRYINLHITDSLHITDAVYANLPASGGVFVTYPAATASSATVRVQTHVINEFTVLKSCVITTTLLDSSGAALQTISSTKSLGAGANDTFVQVFTVTNPRLWSPSAPNLYKVRSQVFDATRPADQQTTAIGIRRIAFSRTSGLQINGAKMYSVGVNRHQDYGAIGCAVPASGQYRDALRLKEAGVNFVRLSHYLQHPAFLDACDKLGIAVEASLVGWQYTPGYANPTFVNNLKRDLRTLVRYYRNHPCIVMWESVMNESSPPAAWSDTAQAIAHAEFPGDQMYTCGQETNDIMDIYQAAVQQGGQSPRSSGKPQAISEYGHWEWGGFTYGGTSSNQPRGIGEAGMLTLAGNQDSAMALDHALSWLSVDALWVYNETFGMTGYNNSLCGGGIVDVFRIPKFNYYFYQSQRDTQLLKVPGAVVNSGPMVYIANFWTSSSPTTVRVFSNCSQVRLSLNGTVIATQSPLSQPAIQHPRFIFTVPFAAGTLVAEGLINGAVRARDTVRTPLTAAKIRITIDTATLPMVADGSDLAIVYGSIVDANGTVLPTAVNPVTFSVNGPGKIISGDGNPVTAVAGIATLYVQGRWNNPGLITVTGSADNLAAGSATVETVPLTADVYSSVRTPHHTPVIASSEGVKLMQLGRKVIIANINAPAGAQPTARFDLYNLQGRAVRSWSIKADNHLAIDLAGCAFGIYYGKLTFEGRHYSLKIIMVKP